MIFGVPYDFLGYETVSLSFLHGDGQVPLNLAF